MTIILDPSREGCTFFSEWFVHTKKGDPIECITWLRERIIDPEDGAQIHDVSVDPFGYGRYYVDIMKGAGIAFTELKRLGFGDLPTLKRY